MQLVLLLNELVLSHIITYVYWLYVVCVYRVRGTLTTLKTFDSFLFTRPYSYGNRIRKYPANIPQSKLQRLSHWSWHNHSKNFLPIIIIIIFFIPHSQIGTKFEIDKYLIVLGLNKFSNTYINLELVI